MVTHGQVLKLQLAAVVVSSTAAIIMGAKLYRSKWYVSDAQWNVFYTLSLLSGLSIKQYAVNMI